MLRDRLRSFTYAFKGIAEVVRHQPNMQIHVVIMMLVLLVAFFLPLHATDWAVLAICMGMVLSAELFNSALEYLTDLVSPDYHPLAGKAKDAAAGAVLVCAFVAVLVGLLIMGPKLMAVLGW